MSKTTAPISDLPFASKDDFIAIGLYTTALEDPLDCSICREPLAITKLIVGTSTATSQLPEIETAAARLTVPGILHGTENPSTIPPPEIPIRIHPCNHIFGSTCLHTWFESSTSNRCPECNSTLFPFGTIHLFLRQPTRAMRLEFANMVEQNLEDRPTAALIRQELMSEWTKVLMRELAIEIHRAQGYEVSWEYVEAEAEEEELLEEEDVELSHDEGLESGSEYEPDEEEEEEEDEDEDEDDDWWRGRQAYSCDGL